MGIKKGAINLKLFSKLASLTNTETQYLYQNVYRSAKNKLPADKLKLMTKLIKAESSILIKELEKMTKQGSEK